jgi:hypothetical protein
MSSDMQYTIRFVEFIDHDYRRKYRVIERIGDIEFAGGMVGDQRKLETVTEIVASVDSAEPMESTSPSKEASAKEERHQDEVAP